MAWTKFNTFAKDAVNGIHNFNSHTFKAMLTNTAPIAANAVKADITEIAAGNGYTAGGVSCAAVTESQSGGTESVFFTNQSITASGGTIGPFRYVVFYNDSVATPVKPLLGYADYGSSITLNATEVINVNFDGTNGFLQAA